MVMKKIPLFLIFIFLFGCESSIKPNFSPKIGLKAPEGLTHQEIVNRVKGLLAGIDSEGIVFVYPPTERPYSKNITEFRYDHSEKAPRTALRQHEWTIVKIDTSNKNEIKIGVSSYRFGCLVSRRVEENETKIMQYIKAHKAALMSIPPAS